MRTPDPNAQQFTLLFTGGHLMATKGLLEAIWGVNFLNKTAAGTSKSVTRQSYTRHAVIGGAGKQVAQTTFTLTRYPHRIQQQARGGQVIKIKYGGRLWSARLSGTVEHFKAWLGTSGAPLNPFEWATEKGGVYTSSLTAV